MKSKIQFLKRFFEPAFLDKGASLKIFINGTSGSLLQTVIPLLFISKIIHLIELEDRQNATSYALLTLFIFSALVIIRSFYMYYWFWAMNIPFEKALYIRYIPEIVRIEPSIFDQNGTGYHLSKFNSGIKSLQNISREILENFPKLLFGMIITLYILFGYGKMVGFLAILYAVLFTVVVAYVYKKELKLIFPTLEIWNRVSGNIGRLMMSKQEILYSNKSSSEVKELEIETDKAFHIEKNAYKYSLKAFYAISNATMFIFLATLCISLIFKINLSTAEVATLALVTSYFYNLTGEIFKLTGVIFDNYKYALSFWEMVDEPKMKNYDEGKEFVHKGGEIELRNISFSYEK